MKILVTGGLGFIGSALIRHLIDQSDHEVINLDKVSYSSSFEAVAAVASSPRYSFEQLDLTDKAAITELMKKYRPEAVIHLAAESHVDRSIDGPEAFIHSNVVGTMNLLQAARDNDRLTRLLHVSTDEVFGSLEDDEPLFSEQSRYDPRSPYSASKASSDHLVRAWSETFELPCMITNCSNNYGPYQFPEKLIPTMIIKALRSEPLPVYGDGANVRDWLHVNDHVAGLLAVLERGELFRSYMIGGSCEQTNIEIVGNIADLVTAKIGDDLNRRDLISFVVDRPGHDRRYAVDSARIQSELGWKPTYDFESGLAQVVDWYLENQSWWQPLLEKEGGARLGLQGVGR